MRIPLLLFFGILVTISSCTKRTLVTEIDHVNQTIDDNVPPPFDGVTSVQINNYINKVYIDLYGREPLDGELEDAANNLKAGGLTLEARDIFLIDVMISPEYYDRFWEIYNSAYLQNIDTEFLEIQIILFTQAYNDAVQDGNIAFAGLILVEIERMQNLLDAPGQYESGQIDVSELMIRVANNPVYDEINMGAENFVVSCFENFFKRYPTEAELPSGVTMVDGFAAQILLEDGSSRTDFLEILMNNSEFYQGLVIDIYQQLLSRLPESAEMGTLTLELSDNKDYQAIQRKLMITEEYAGF